MSLDRNVSPIDTGSPQGRGVAARPGRDTERRLWFSILVGPAAWTVTELAGFAIVGRLCGVASGDLTSWQRVAFYVIPAAGALATVAGLVVAVRVFRRWSDAGRITRAEGWNRVEFMAMAGAIISFFMLVNIIYFGVLPMVVHPCLRTT